MTTHLTNQSLADRVDLDMLTRDVIAMLRTVGMLRAIEVTVSPPRSRHVVAADRARVEQVLINLVVNAAEAITPGTIAIEIESTERVAIRVRDTGCGIPPELVERVVEPHFTTKGLDRISLGLSIVRDIVESYGGTLQVDSVVGEGTTVSVDLPLASD
jgi:signal transduction histidine kinase